MLIFDIITTADWHVGVSSGSEPFPGEADDVKSCRQLVKKARMTCTHTHRSTNIAIVHLFSLKSAVGVSEIKHVYLLSYAATYCH